MTTHESVRLYVLLGAAFFLVAAVLLWTAFRLLRHAAPDDRVVWGLFPVALLMAVIGGTSIARAIERSGEPDGVDFSETPGVVQQLVFVPGATSTAVVAGSSGPSTGIVVAPERRAVVVSNETGTETIEGDYAKQLFTKLRQGQKVTLVHASYFQLRDGVKVEINRQLIEVK